MNTLDLTVCQCLCGIVLLKKFKKKLLKIVIVGRDWKVIPFLRADPGVILDSG